MLDLFVYCQSRFFQGKTNEDIVQYFKDCLAFHIKEYCAADASRVINSVIHMDEKVPHMQVASVPLVTDEKGTHLSAKTIMAVVPTIGQGRTGFMMRLQNRGLDRGEAVAPAERKLHTAKREWQIATQDNKLRDAQEQVRQAQTQLTNAQQALLQAQEQERKEKAKAETVQAKTEAETKVLAKVLDMKARASEIHHVFGDKETQTYHANMLDNTRKIGDEAYENLKQAQ